MAQITMQVDVKDDTNYTIKILEAGSKELPCLVIPVEDIKNRMEEIMRKSKVGVNALNYKELEKLLLNPEYNK